MRTEYEVRKLNISFGEMIQSLESLGAKKIGEYHQKRYVYDFIPAQKGRWIRLRTNGEDTTLATVYKGNIIKNLIMDCQSYTKYRPNETTGGIFVSWRRKEELPTGA